MSILKREDIKKVCWHILENCTVIYRDHVVSGDKDKLVDIVEVSIEQFDAMVNGEEKTGVYY